MKAKTWIWFTVICLFILSLGFFLIEKDGPTLLAVAGGYTAALSGWLGYDIAKTRDRTLAMKPGDFEDIKLGRYLFALISIGVLLIISIVNTDPMNPGIYTSAKLALVPALYGMATLIIIAYGANKTATSRGPNE